MRPLSEIASSLSNRLDEWEAKLSNAMELPPEPKKEWGRTTGSAREPGGHPVMMSSFDTEWWKWYRSYPIEGRAIEEAFRQARRLLRPIQYDEEIRLEAPRWLRDYLTGRALSEAREITFSAHNVPAAGYSSLLGGALRFEGDFGGLGMDFVALRRVRETVKMAWGKDGGVMLSGELGGAYGIGVVIPEDYLTPENVEEAFQRWYAARHEWQRGHWTAGGEKPALVLDVEWETADDSKWKPKEKEAYRAWEALSQRVRMPPEPAKKVARKRKPAKAAGDKAGSRGPRKSGKAAGA